VSRSHRCFSVSATDFISCGPSGLERCYSQQALTRGFRAATTAQPAQRFEQTHHQHYNERVATVPLALIQSASDARSDRTQIPWHRTLSAAAGGGTGGHGSRYWRAASFTGTVLTVADVHNDRKRGLA